MLSTIFDVVDHIDNIGRSQGIPTSIIVELTYRCNFKCPHCYLAEADGGHYPKEISGAQFCAILDQLPEIGTFATTFQGGEIFIHPEWEEILAHSRNLGMHIGIKTNGTPLTPARLEFLKTLSPMLLVMVSLYGMDAESHELVTGVPGSFRKFKDAVERTVAAGIPTRLNMLLTRANVHQIGAAKKWAAQLGIKLTLASDVTRQVDGGVRPLEQRLSVAELLTFEKEYGEGTVEYYSCGETQHYSCPMGVDGFVITPYGKMNYCVDMGEPQLDVLATPVKQRWAELKAHAVNIKSDMDKGCGTCELFKGCSACAADLWQENKSFTSCSPFYKEWAEGRFNSLKDA